MKRALLFIFAALSSYSGFSQTDTLYSGFKNSQYDTAASLIAISFPAGSHGSVAGVNDQGRSKFAQLYTMFNKPYGWTITGCISNWVGRTQVSSSRSLTIKVWKVDSSNAVKNDVNTIDSVTGFPGAELGNKSVSFSTLSPTVNPTPTTPIYHPLHTVTTFTTGIPVNRPFFLGYEMPSGYVWGSSMLGDTLHLATTAQATGGVFTVLNNARQNYYAHIVAGPPKDTCFLSVNCYYDGTGRWQDYNWKDGVLMTLEIVPIVTQWSDNVQGITRNNLTFFGNYPNPAVNTTNIKFSLVNSSDVSIEIMDINGRGISVINQPNMGAGDHVIPVSTANLASGVYIYMIKAGADAFASQMTVTK
jgi:hypothetical protein